MHRNTVRRALTCVALLSAFAVFSPARAGSITLNDPNCDSFALGGTAPNQTLTCVVSSVPVCTVNGPGTAQINTSVTLTAQCSPAATSYSWTGGNCSTGQSCSATESSAATKNYTVAGTNGTGAGSTSAALSVVWSNAPPAAPSGCTLTPNPTSLPAGGGAVTLTAACSGGGAPTNYVWTGGSIPSSGTSAQVLTSVTATTTFTVKPSNGGGNGNLASTSVTVAGSGGGGGGAISCPGYSSVIVLNLNYAPGVQSRVVTSSVFGNNDIVVAKFTTGTLSNYGKGGFLNVVENADGPVVRTAALSTTPCDFTQGVNNVSSNVAWPQVNFSAPNSYGTPLQSNTTYYLNVVNKTNTGGATCSTGDCPVAVTLQGR